ncbi:MULTISPECIES: DUF3667 domain-containing protein [Elizabethkingia]|uniref:DUF3667 domain-containing protein n=2 Tax=Elizabethkingia anophelis TaxID=1117645 RepID=X5K990_9FLAO|nr:MULTISPECIES: DUF3667 domain-containing protein [Elizabethkingia]AIL45940.1 hypothetical protein BD94_2165 [Elizabethkingia anophelis NUHP1]AMR40691.1 hypothetical protein A2T74_04640 [Elizabethkingia anophelis]AMX47326.1 hypothetical protein A4C56_04640 [Elizabethkingia anophelis]AMX50787.1 hypothetical protein A2T72_04640 [Elizabethkingia anophelis]AMX54179.1 hypothetical protein A2T59_04640 [Elizabethkingia anophelis]
MTNNCLNCNEELVGKYCNNCSQPASTHRFSLSHVFKHDFVHGIFHFDKGFFFTIKELFTRPGHSIREYVQGKRVKHFNYFATVLLLLTIIYFVKKWAKIESSDLFDTNVKGLLKVQKDYSKITVFLNIPIIAFISFLLFQRSKQNYTENLVLNMYLLCGLTVISLILPICMIFTDNKEFLFIVNYFVTALVFLYIIIFYYQYFSVFNYKKYDLIIRIILISILYMAIKQLINTILNNVGLKYFH